MGILTKAKELSTPLVSFQTGVISAASRRLTEARAKGLPTAVGQLGGSIAGVIGRRSTSRDESAPVFAGTEQPWRRRLSEQEPEEALPVTGRAVVEATDESPVPEEVAKALEGLASPLEGQVAAADGSPQPPPQDRAPVAAKEETSSLMATDLRDLFAAEEKVNEEFARLLRVLEDVDINYLVLQTREVAAQIQQLKQR